MQKRKILSSFISLGSYDEFIDKIIKLSAARESSYVCVCNVHMLLEAKDSIDFNRILNNADIVTPDGMPIAKAIKYIYNIPQDRVAGMDLLPDLITKCSERKKKIFFYGSTQEVLDEIKLRINTECPNLVVKFYSPPFRVLDNTEKKTIVDMINEFNADFTFVALGCPKQEKWMHEHLNKINSCMIGLGAAFEVYAGLSKRAPNWMQKHSLEWFFRLIHNPARLWRRYLHHNPRFIWYLCLQILRTRLYSNYEK